MLSENLKNAREKQRYTVKELSQLISYELKEPSVTGMVSVTRVKVTPDLKFAKVSVSILNNSISELFII